MSRRSSTWLVAIVALTAAHRADAQPATAGASETLQRGIELFQANDYFAATIELERVAQRETQDSEAGRQRAELLISEALHRLGYHAASLARLAGRTAGGLAQPDLHETVRLLVALAGELPADSGISDKIGGYDAALLDDPALAEFRDQLYYLRGCDLMRRGELDEAVASFAQVGKQSPRYLAARFYTGVALVRLLDGERAVDAFKELLVVASAGPGRYPAAEVNRFAEVARLQLARIFFSTQQFDLALKYYQEIPRRAPEYPAALREAAWADERIGRHSHALAALQALRAPFLHQTHMPEADLLEAFIYLERCLRQDALVAASRLMARYRVLPRQATKELATLDDNDALAARATEAARAANPSPLDALIEDTLRDPGVVAILDWRAYLGRELARLDQAPQAWRSSEVAARVLEDLTLEHALASSDAGRLVRSGVERRLEEMRHALRDGLRLRIRIEETRGPSAGDAPLPGGRTRPAWEPAEAPSWNRDAPVVIPGDHLLWKLNGGFATGKRGDYRFRLELRCPSRSDRAGPPPADEPDPVPDHDFRNDQIDGDLATPDMTIVDIDRIPPLIHLPDNFIAEILRTADDLRARGLL